MARDTDPNLQKQVIYSVYVRNHTDEGTFRALIADLDRIRALGTDIVWLMHIHPIGTLQRKGTLGSPYAIRDYRAVNPEYGTLEDFRILADEIRKRGMK
ncbi:MAG: alpha-amylase, partial [Firmicutes bacterium]|nr:alpha-amylase [Bacillota bacterium]